MIPPHVVLLDSIAAIGPQHAGYVVITGSHGGLSAARFAAAVPVALVVFNDAGGGKDGAGIAGLAALDAQGVAAAAVTHSSARIGDAADSWASGVLAAVNRSARERYGLAVGQRVSMALAEVPVAPR